MTENNSIVIYQSEDGKVHLDVVYNEETMWLSQQQLCELYQTSKSNVSEHIKHIFEDGELVREATVRKFRTVQIEGTRKVEREGKEQEVIEVNECILMSRNASPDAILRWGSLFISTTSLLISFIVLN